MVNLITVKKYHVFTDQLYKPRKKVSQLLWDNSVSSDNAALAKSCQKALSKIEIKEAVYTVIVNLEVRNMTINQVSQVQCI